MGKIKAMKTAEDEAFEELERAEMWRKRQIEERMAEAEGGHMTERLIEKIDRLANEAGIKEVTPEIRRFAMLVRQDVVAQWPKKEPT